MLPDDPVLRGRLFRAARSLLGWSQAGLACAAGASTALVCRVEAGCPGAGTRAVAALAAAVEGAGVRFVGVADAAGHGLRYAARPVPGGPPGGEDRAGRSAAAADRVARQRALVARLEAAGAGAQAAAGLARRLLGEMERARETMARSRELVAGVHDHGRLDAEPAPPVALAA
jgi:hypothetical protein